MLSAHAKARKLAKSPSTLCQTLANLVTEPHTVRDKAKTPCVLTRPLESIQTHAVNLPQGLMLDVEAYQIGQETKGGQ